jgi:hypothetical protein
MSKGQKFVHYSQHIQYQNVQFLCGPHEKGMCATNVPDRITCPVCRDKFPEWYVDNTAAGQAMAGQAGADRKSAIAFVKKQMGDE